MEGKVSSSVTYLRSLTIVNRDFQLVPGNLLLGDPSYSFLPPSRLSSRAVRPGVSVVMSVSSF